MDTDPEPRQLSPVPLLILVGWAGLAAVNYQSVRQRLMSQMTPGAVEPNELATFIVALFEALPKACLFAAIVLIAYRFRAHLADLIGTIIIAAIALSVLAAIPRGCSTDPTDQYEPSRL